MTPEPESCGLRSFSQPTQPHEAEPAPAPHSSEIVVCKNSHPWVASGGASGIRGPTRTGAHQNPTLLPGRGSGDRPNSPVELMDSISTGASKARRPSPSPEMTSLLFDLPDPSNGRTEAASSRPEHPAVSRSNSPSQLRSQFTRGRRFHSDSTLICEAPTNVRLGLAPSLNEPT